MKHTCTLVVAIAALLLSGCNLEVRSESQATHDDGHGEAVHEEPAHRERPRAKPRKKRYFVGGYREKYHNLPNRGSSKRFFRGHVNQVDMGKGYIHGNVKFLGPNGEFKRGNGKGRTVIDGHLEIKGSGWRLENVTITGNIKIRGHNNLIKAEIFGRVDQRGGNNRIIRQ